MAEPLLVEWTDRALRNTNSIRKYLLSRFSETEVLNFENLLREFVKNVSIFPSLYPQSQKQPDLRKAVLHRNTSVFYSHKNNKIIVVAIQDNRQEKPGV